MTQGMPLAAARTYALKQSGLNAAVGAALAGNAKLLPEQL